MELAAIITLVQAAVAVAPQAIEIVTKAKDLIAALFGAKLITKAEQDALHAHMDSIQALALAGIIPESWKVEPDPQ